MTRWPQTLKCIVKVKCDLDVFFEKYGENYDRMFTPVMKHSAQDLFKGSTCQKLHVKHFDAKTAFLNEEFTKELVLNPPEVYIKKDQPHLVYKLHVQVTCTQEKKFFKVMESNKVQIISVYKQKLELIITFTW